MRRQSRFNFWKYVDRKGPTECWPWVSAVSQDGYPRFGAEGTQWHVTHLIWEQKHGVVPHFPDTIIMHLCNHPWYCNPEHLRLGTPSMNMIHAGLCGTLSRPRERNGNAKLTEEQVAAIKTDKRPSRAVAAAYGIEKTQVLRIRKGIQWA